MGFVILTKYQRHEHQSERIAYNQIKIKGQEQSLKASAQNSSVFSGLNPQSSALPQRQIANLTDDNDA